MADTSPQSQRRERDAKLSERERETAHHRHTAFAYLFKDAIETRECSGKPGPDLKQL